MQDGQKILGHICSPKKRCVESLSRPKDEENGWHHATLIHEAEEFPTVLSLPQTFTRNAWRVRVDAKSAHTKQLSDQTLVNRRFSIQQAQIREKHAASADER